MDGNRQAADGQVLPGDSELLSPHDGEDKFLIADVFKTKKSPEICGYLVLKFFVLMCFKGSTQKPNHVF